MKKTRIKISHELLQDMLGFLPDGAKIVETRHDGPFANLDLHVEGIGQEVPEGAVTPVADVSIDSDTAKVYRTWLNQCPIVLSGQKLVLRELP